MTMLLPHLPRSARIVANGKFRVLGSQATYNTQQFYLYLKHAGVPHVLHTSSVYGVGIMAMFLRADAFFCVVPPEKSAPTLHSWVDLVAYFEYARKLSRNLPNASAEQQQQQQLPSSSEKKHFNWMSSSFPQSALDSTTLEPDALTQPRRRVVALSLSLYAAWWLQNTSGYFRWVYALALEREEEIREAAFKMSNPAMKDLPFQKGATKHPIPESVKAHARFFLLLDWGGSAVGQIVRKQMIRTMSDYGIRRELHGFLTQHLSDLCVQLDAHFRVYRYLLATEEPTLCDIMFAAAFEFILKDDPPKYEVMDGSMLHLERWLADVTMDEEKYVSIVEEIESGKSRKRFSAGTAKAGVLFPFGGKASNRDMVKALEEDAARLAQAGDEEGAAAKKKPSSLAAALSSSSSSRRSKQQQHHLPDLNRELDPEPIRVNTVPVPGSSSPRHTVPLRQLTSTDDVVPETLSGVLALMQEVFPWLEAQRNSIEDRINILLETKTPMDSVTLPDSPSLGEFAAATVPMAMKLPRLVPKAWEMEVENPTTNLGDLAGADEEVEMLPWNKKNFKKEAAAHLAVENERKVKESAHGHGGDNDASGGGGGENAPDILDTGIGAVDKSSLNLKQFPTTVLPCGTSMPHLYMAQFVSQECERCDFSSVPAPETVQRPVGHVVPMAEEKLRELQDSMAQLRLEEPWAIAPQFAERDDVEYIVFRKQKLAPNGEPSSSSSSSSSS